MSDSGPRAPNPEFEAVVREALAAMPFARLLGVAVAALAPGHAELFIAGRPELHQGEGFFQAGVVGSVADFAGGAAAATLLAAGFGLMTVDFDVKLVAPAIGDRLIGRADVVRPGQTLAVSRVEVLSSHAGRERLSAVALVTTKSFERPRRAALDRAGV